MTRTQSFDLFDTLVTRAVLEPKDLFIRLGELLARRGLVTDAEEFARHRAATELAARKATDAPEVTLQQIYDRLARDLHWRDCDTGLAVDLELGLERAYSRPIATTGEALRRHRVAGITTAVVSDTYLPEALISDLLQQHDIGPERLLVSSSHLRTKSTGLFASLEAKGPYSHTGDNLEADVRATRRFGGDATRFLAAQPNRYERRVYELKAGSRLDRSLMAGAMRAARLSRVFSDRHLQRVWEVACDVAGPLLFAYVHWLLDDAVRLGLPRLYFVTREGQILLRIARAIAAGRPEYAHLDMRYLYGSRAAWQPDSAAAREDAIAYMRSAGALDGTPFGLVDLGWRGSLQQGFAGLFGGQPGEPQRVVGYYMGMYRAPDLPANHDYRAFLRDPRRPSASDYIVCFEPVMELFTAADHGPTLGYELRDGVPAPRLKYNRNEAALDWGLVTQQDGIMAFVDSYLAASADRALSPALEHEAASTLLETFLFSPTAAEAEAYGRVDVFEDSSEQKARRMAPALSPLDLARMALRRSGKHSLWLPASVARYGPALQLSVKLAYRARYLRSRLRSPQPSPVPSVATAPAQVYPTI